MLKYNTKELIQALKEKDWKKSESLLKSDKCSWSNMSTLYHTPYFYDITWSNLPQHIQNIIFSHADTYDATI